MKKQKPSKPDNRQWFQWNPLIPNEAMVQHFIETALSMGGTGTVHAKACGYETDYAYPMVIAG